MNTSLFKEICSTYATGVTVITSKDSTNKDYVFIKYDEYIDLIQNKRIQYQVNFKSKKLKRDIIQIFSYNI